MFKIIYYKRKVTLGVFIMKNLLFILADAMPEINSREQLKAHILYKLSRHRRWGAKHTALEHVKSALPQAARPIAEELAKELADEGFITWLKKTNEIHISLNPHQKAKILGIVERYYGKQIW